MDVSKPPPVKGGVVPYLIVDGAMKAAEFYQRAFGAETVFAYPVDDNGRTMHVHLYTKRQLGDAERCVPGTRLRAGKAAGLQRDAASG